MPRYFFNVKKDSHAPDRIGVDLSNAASARLEGVRLLAEDLRAHPDDFWDDEEWEIEVSDEHGLILFTLHSSAIRSSAMSR